MYSKMAEEKRSGGSAQRKKWRETLEGGNEGVSVSRREISLSEMAGSSAEEISYWLAMTREISVREINQMLSALKAKWKKINEIVIFYYY